MYCMQSNTDEELVDLVKDGDHEAFGILTRRHVDHIYNFIRQYTTSSSSQKEDTDDITQETFLKAWKHIGGFKKGKKFTTWLFTIARNSALDHIKKRRAFSFSDMDSFGGNDDESEGGGDGRFAETLKDPEPLSPEIFERKELALELTKAMDTLPPDWRAVLVMHYTDDMTFEEIATVISRPMNTVKSWHHRAIQKIREILTTHHND